VSKESLGNQERQVVQESPRKIKIILRPKRSFSSDRESPPPRSRSKLKSDRHSSSKKEKRPNRSQPKKKHTKKKRDRNVDDKSKRQVKYSRASARHISACIKGCCCSQQLFLLIKENREKSSSQITSFNGRLMRVESDLNKLRALLKNDI
jgi:hypothetical protein